MNSSSDNTLFYAQHKNKCYCQNRNLCYCTGIEDPARNSKNSSSPTYKFIKVRSDKNKDNKQLKSISLCSKNSFSPAPTMMTSISGSSMTTGGGGGGGSVVGGGSPSNPKLTGRRELYERSKIEGAGFIQNFNVGKWNVQEHILFSGVGEHSQIHNSDEEIAKLQEFRLQNVDECLSSCNRYSMDKKVNELGKSKEQSVEQIKYTLNSRGLLKQIGGNDNGRAAIVPSKLAVNDILRQKLNSSKDKDKLIRKALCLPENSLALRYQKTY